MVTHFAHDTHEFVSLVVIQDGQDVEDHAKPGLSIICEGFFTGCGDRDVDHPAIVGVDIALDVRRTALVLERPNNARHLCGQDPDGFLNLADRHDRVLAEQVERNIFRFGQRIDVFIAGLSAGFGDDVRQLKDFFTQGFKLLLVLRIGQWGHRFRPIGLGAAKYLIRKHIRRSGNKSTRDRYYSSGIVYDLRQSRPVYRTGPAFGRQVTPQGAANRNSSRPRTIRGFSHGNSNKPNPGQNRAWRAFRRS